MWQCGITVSPSSRLVAGDVGSCLLGYGCTYVAPVGGYCPGDQKKAAMRARLAAARNTAVAANAAANAAVLSAVTADRARVAGVTAGVAGKLSAATAAMASIAMGRKVIFLPDALFH